MLIEIPNNNIEERKYIINVILKEFLGLEFDLLITTTENYKFKFLDKEIIIKDGFFNKFETDLSYLKRENIPLKVKYTKCEFAIEENIPVIFGDDSLIYNKSSIICGNDIFASSFFMLSRWEELFNCKPDKYMRFSGKESFAFKNDFLDRPIVNEYIEMLWNMLIYLGFDKQRCERSFSFTPTHDVDHLRYYPNFLSLFKKIGRDIIKNKDFFSWRYHIKKYIQINLKMKKDPYDTFDWLMDLSEDIGVKSRFYFMSSNKEDQDNRYDISSPISSEILKKIQKRNHIVGFHPSLNSCTNKEIWSAEKKLLEEVIDEKIYEGRQHYLKFDLTKTWGIWDENEMRVDSSMSYYDAEGFRSGVCYEYSVFDLLARKHLSLKESPLIVMEGSLKGYQNYTPDEMLERIKFFIDITKKYKGNFVLLWHNSSFNIPYWKKYNETYISLFKYLKKESKI